MELSPKEKEIQDNAITYAKANRTKICRELTNKELYLAEESPVSVFMSGSPGAGKTETSRSLVDALTKSDGGSILRLDPDDLRSKFENYDGTNSFLFQRAVTVLVEKAFDFMMKNAQSFILDGTLASYNVAEKNIQRCLKRDRSVLIIFVYQRPELAWSFVQAREKTEGRRILPEHFVDQFFGSQEVVNRLKKEFGNKIRIHLLVKDTDNITRKFYNDVSNLTSYLKPLYTRDEVLNIVNTASL